MQMILSRLQFVEAVTKAQVHTGIVVHWWQCSKNLRMFLLSLLMYKTDYSIFVAVCGVFKCLVLSQEPWTRYKSHFQNNLLVCQTLKTSEMFLQMSFVGFFTYVACGVCESLKVGINGHLKHLLLTRKASKPLADPQCLVGVREDLRTVHTYKSLPPEGS